MAKAEKPDQAALRDEEVLRQSLQTPSAFKILVDRYEPAFLRKAREVLGGREEVADVVVETFTKIYFKAGRFREIPGASFKSWAYKILLNTAFSYYQRLKRDGKFVELESEFRPLADQADTRTVKNDFDDWVASVLSRMPQELARPLRLYYLEDRPQRDIARIENLSLSAVKTRIYRAKKLFKKISVTN